MRCISVDGLHLHRCCHWCVTLDDWLSVRSGFMDFPRALQEGTIYYNIYTACQCIFSSFQSQLPSCLDSSTIVHKLTNLLAMFSTVTQTHTHWTGSGTVTGTNKTVNLQNVYQFWNQIHSVSPQHTVLFIIKCSKFKLFKYCCKCMWKYVHTPWSGMQHLKLTPVTETETVNISRGHRLTAIESKLYIHCRLSVH